MQNQTKHNFTNKFQKKQTLTTTALILMMTIAVTLVALPATNAHTPPWSIPTYAYIAVSPDPIGVGQSAFVIIWLDKPPPTAAGIGGDRWTSYTVEVTKPDGTKETLGPYTSDATSSIFTLYTPTQVGKYTFLFKFPGQTASLYNPSNGIAGTTSPFVNDTYLASSASTTLTVQQNPVVSPPTYPRPTSYWTRPIEGQNTAWAAIASNYLNPNVAEHNALANRLQSDGTAPSASHVMWTKPIQNGGIVGGSDVGVFGASYYAGLSYEGRFATPVVMYGRLYYGLPRSNNAVGGGYTCVDLRTGEQIWWQNYTVNPSFGQIYNYESFNQHGAIPNGYLWATSGTTWLAYDPLDGNWLFNLTDVPSGTNVYGPNGEILRYVFNNNQHWLALWNNTAAPVLAGATGTSSAVYQWRPVGKIVNASTAYTWNVTIPTLPAGSIIAKAIMDDLILGYIPTLPSGQRWGTVDPYSFWAVSLKPATRGQLLWTKNYQVPSGNLTRLLYAVDPATRVFLMNDKETMQWSAYSLDSGNQLWGPVGDARDFNYYGTIGMGSAGQAGFAAYGRLYSGGYGGELFCYDLKNGSLLWKYNNTFSGTETPWGNYPISIGAIADGKIYVYTSEHSPNAPLYKGSRVRCIDAYTGKELWTVMGWAAIGSFGSEGFPVADGYIAYLNTYDSQIYCIGKGPSATTVTASPKVSTKGSSVIIEGTVTDQAEGAKQLVANGIFNIVPAMSDESMGPWMEYLYMQKPKPENSTGVTVKLTAIDPNGNTQDIGTVTSDMSGLYSIMWQPPVEGKYTIIATFAGSESYYASYAETAIGVSAAPAASPTATPAPTATTTPTPAPTATPTASPSPAPQPEAGPSTDMYIIAAAAIVIIVVVAVAALALRKRK